MTEENKEAAKPKSETKKQTIQERLFAATENLANGMDLVALRPKDKEGNQIQMTAEDSLELIAYALLSQAWIMAIDRCQMITQAIKQAEQKGKMVHPAGVLPS